VKRRLVAIAVLCLAALAYDPSARQPQLQTTAHPVLPRDLDSLWFVPGEKERARQAALYEDLAEAARRYATGDYSASLKLASRAATVKGSLRDYATLYVGLSQLRVRHPDARRTLDTLRQSGAQGYLPVAAALASGEAAEAAGDYAAAVSIYEPLTDDRTVVNADVLTRLGGAALAAGDRRKAAEAYGRVYYEFALTETAAHAAAQLATLQDQIVRTGYKADLGRASILFGARRYADARTAYAAIVGQTSGDDRELAELRIAECDFFLRRYRPAMDGLRPHLDRASRRAEARFFYLSALRDAGQHDEYVVLTRALLEEFPESTWSEEALNNLGTHYILNNEDELAASAFAELYRRFPSGQRAERAAWKAGWWSYKNDDYDTTVRTFESAAQAFPRSDYRPSFLYWAARSHANLNQRTEALERFHVVHADYGNSYYGRLASQQIARREAGLASAERAVAASRQPVTTAVPRPPTYGRIRNLLAAGLYDDALNELRHAQRRWGGSPALDATLAWAYHRKGELRRAISIMRRAYPQFLTTGGDEMPAEILEVIFPLTYWPSIRKHAAARGLDPYLIAALIAQESTFDPKIRSVANAWGLMQIVPATGRRLARTLNIRRFNTGMLTDPEINIRMGTLFFSQLVKQFGGTHYALAGYNAGESRVVRWKAERPGLDEDEFIDDIPFPETQNYVKRILGTAEDYRRLYGEGGGKPIPVLTAKPTGKATSPRVPRRQG
jgi:soluble lytic murein transglycosylase